MQGPSERLGSTITAAKWPAKTDGAESRTFLRIAYLRRSLGVQGPPGRRPSVLSVRFRPIGRPVAETSVDKSHRPKSERMAGMGGEETFFVIRPVDPSKMVPKLAGV